MLSPVLVATKDLRGRSSRWSLYSIGPSWGSDSSLSTSIFPLVPHEDNNPPLGGVMSSIGFGVVFRGVDHGDDTRIGSV